MPRSLTFVPTKTVSGLLLDSLICADTKSPTWSPCSTAPTGAQTLLAIEMAALLTD